MLNFSRNKRWWLCWDYFLYRREGHDANRLVVHRINHRIARCQIQWKKSSNNFSLRASFAPNPCGSIAKSLPCLIRGFSRKKLLWKLTVRLSTRHTVQSLSEPIWLAMMSLRRPARPVLWLRDNTTTEINLAIKSLSSLSKLELTASAVRRLYSKWPRRESYDSPWYRANSRGS